MFDENLRKDLKKAAKSGENEPILTKNGSVGPTFDWSRYRTDDLIRFMDEIRACLPSTKLSEMNLEEELVLQYHTVRALQNDVLQQEEIPLNQRAQLANSVSSVLSKLADLQNEIYSSERFKVVENLLIRMLSRLPENVAAQFLAEYEDALNRATRH
jgi:hypothetical protein